MGGPKASFSRLLQAEVMPRRLERDAAVINAKANDARSAAAVADAVARNEGALARRDLNRLRDELQAVGGGAGKRERVSQLDVSARKHETAAAAALEKQANDTLAREWETLATTVQTEQE